MHDLFKRTHSKTSLQTLVRRGFGDRTVSIISLAELSSVLFLLTQPLCLQGPAIAVRFASDVNITGNTIINPMAAVSDNTDNISAPIDSGSAIYLDIVKGSVHVSGNVIVGINDQNVPQVNPPLLERLARKCTQAFC